MSRCAAIIRPSWAWGARRHWGAWRASTIVAPVVDNGVRKHKDGDNISVGDRECLLSRRKKRTPSFSMNMHPSWAPTCKSKQERAHVKKISRASRNIQATEDGPQINKAHRLAERVSIGTAWSPDCIQDVHSDLASPAEVLDSRLGKLHD